MQGRARTEVLFIGGRSGAGKTSVAYEVSRLLAEARVAHAHIEGDNLDAAYPVPWKNGVDLAGRNLAAMWGNYREAGYPRLIYTNTVSVLEREALVAALGGDARVTAVLLTATDATARERLAGREVGSELEAHVERSGRAGRRLRAEAPASVHRIATDGRTVIDIAREVVALTGWARGAGANVTMRDADPAEVEACVELWVRACAARDGAAVDGVAQRARAKFGRGIAWVVAESGERIVGFALATAPGSGAPRDRADAAVLGLLAVEPTAQGAGLGRRLLSAIDGAIAEAGFTRAVLHVLADNTAAARLYESAGWRPEGEPFDHPLLHRPSQSYVIELRGLAPASILMQLCSCTLGGGMEIRQSIEIAAPIETVWGLISEPGWWINDGELEPHEVSLSAQPDGTLIAEVRGHSWGTWRLVIVDLIEHEYAAFRWAPHAAADRDATGPTGSTLVEFTLRQASDHVVVEVVESGFDALDVSPEKIAANYADNTDGWGQELAALKSAAEA